MKKIILLVVMLSAMLPGCTRTGSTVQTQPRLVTQITADYRSGSIQLYREYTDSEKMRAVLDYLRCLEPYGTVSEEPTEDTHVLITLRYSDGTTKIYDQRENQYLREGSGKWKNISAEKGRELPLLLGLMESD